MAIAGGVWCHTVLLRCGAIVVENGVRSVRAGGIASLVNVEVDFGPVVSGTVVVPDTVYCVVRFVGDSAGGEKSFG